MYNELVYHLDLCILAYQLYGQTLAWPMDPYYEQERRKLTSRRDNFKAHLLKNKALFPENHGDLDPVLFNYERLFPWVPCFVKPEEKWDIFNTPKEITDTIGNLFMQKLDGSEGHIIHPDIISPKSRNDDLYCFEGKTGNIKDYKVGGTKSFMGFILVRDRTPDGPDYDIHIVFRGSRSGSGERAFVHGKREKGSADWVTDMDFGILKQDLEISKQGLVCRGFCNSLRSMQDNIRRCMAKIQAQRKRPPRKIYLSGHSLGGALATHCASWLSQGDPTGEKVLTGWPFHDMKVFTYGAPVTGNKAFCNYLAVNVQIIRAYINGDKVPQEKLNGRGRPTTPQTHAGNVLSIPPVEAGGIMWLNHHEPSNTRRALLRWLWNNGIDIKKIPAGDGLSMPPGAITPKPDEPWFMCKSIIDVLSHPSLKGDNAAHISRQLHDLIADKNYLDSYLKAMHHILTDYTSYKQLKKFEKTMKAKVTAIQEVMADQSANLESIQKKFTDLKPRIDDSDTYNLLLLCAVLRRIIQVPADAEQLLNNKKLEPLKNSLKVI